MGNNIQNQQLFIRDSQKWVSWGGKQGNKKNMMYNYIRRQKAVYKFFSNIQEQDARSYLLRKRHQCQLVNIHGILPPRSYDPDCRLRILIEYIPYRLSDLGILSYCDALYILKQCTEGIKVIAQEFGELTIASIQFEPDMIGINSFGKCKFWPNSNYFESLVSLHDKSYKDIQKHENNYMSIQNNPQQSFSKVLSSPKQGKTNYYHHLPLLQKLFRYVQSRMLINQEDQYNYQKIKNQIFGVQYINQSLSYNIQSCVLFLNKLMLMYNNTRSFERYRLNVPSQLQQIEQKLQDTSYYVKIDQNSNNCKPIKDRLNFSQVRRILNNDKGINKSAGNCKISLKHESNRINLNNSLYEQQTSKNSQSRQDRNSSIFQRSGLKQKFLNYKHTNGCTNQSPANINKSMLNRKVQLGKNLKSNIQVNTIIHKHLNLRNTNLSGLRMKNNIHSLV